MKKILVSGLVATLLLSACGGPKTVGYKGDIITYDAGTWKEFSNETAIGLQAKGDESCWIDLSGTLTTPLSSEELSPASEGKYTLYFAAGESTARYVSFKPGREDVFGTVSVEDAAGCQSKFMDLAEMN